MAETINERIAQLKHNDVAVRTAAAASLGKSGDPRALDALKEAFRPYEYIPPTDELYIFYVTVAIVLAENGVFAPYTQIAETDREPPFVRTRVREKLQQVGAQRAMRAAVKMLTSSDRWESRWGVLILASLTIPDEEASNALAELVRIERDSHHRREILWALGHVGTATALPALNAIVSDSNTTDQTRERVTEAITKIRQRTVRDLPPVLNEGCLSFFRILSALLTRR